MSATLTVASGEHPSAIRRKYGVRAGDLSPWDAITDPAALAPPMA